MTNSTDFISYIKELLQGFGNVTVKRMFGGHGIFREELMFGIIDDDVLYFKVDDDNRADFEERDLGPFTYKRKDKLTSLSYYQTPEDVFDEQEEMMSWAGKGFDAALRADKLKSLK